MSMGKSMGARRWTFDLHFNTPNMGKIQHDIGTGLHVEVVYFDCMSVTAHSCVFACPFDPSHTLLMASRRSSFAHGLRVLSEDPQIITLNCLPCTGALCFMDFPCFITETLSRFPEMNCSFFKQSLTEYMQSYCRRQLWSSFMRNISQRSHASKTE